MSGELVTIEAQAEPGPEHVAAIARLLPQLSSAPPPDLATLRAVAAGTGTSLFFARREDEIVGTLTLLIVQTPSGLRSWIEDVVVDESARGAGIGRALVERALEVAREAGARTVDLTSRPSRVAANELYQRVGFVQRETNLYRFSFEP